MQKKSFVLYKSISNEAFFMSGNFFYSTRQKLAYLYSKIAPLSADETSLAYLAR